MLLSDPLPLSNRHFQDAAGKPGHAVAPLAASLPLVEVMPAFKAPRHWSTNDRWDYLIQLYGDPAFIPEQITTELWTPAVTGALAPPDDCPACAEADEMAALCPYHRSRLCDICGGISYCRGWCP